MIMWGLVCGRLLSGLFQKQIISPRALNKTCSLHGPVRWMATCRPAPLLRATPCRALIDELIALKAYHLPRNSPVTMRARMTCEDGHLWQSVSHYHTDEDGVVDLTKHPSVGGSYVGCEPMGLFWSLQPAPGGKQGLRLRKKHVETPYTVDVSVLEGHISPLNSSRDEQISREHELATVSLQRWYMVPGVRKIEIRQNRVVGTLFLPPGPGPFPAVLDLWGLARGLVEYRAALFASHGLACMTLAYFGHKDLPGPPKRISVGDSYFKAAWQVLCDHPQVCEDRIAIIGISFGVFVALRIATSLSVNPRCVVCINGPFCNVNKLFGEDGENTDEEQKHWNSNDQGYVSFKDFSLPCNVPPENFIQIEKVRCPLLFIIGEDDLCCPSIENADEIERRLRTADKSQLFTRVSYPGAGHLIEPPYAPTCHTSVWASQPTQSMIQWGGNLKQHAAAQKDSWPRILTFLERNLRGEDTA
ncbi:acyl-coenzyme A amino acid N-acyltransferase 2 isoform X1 [Pangasianodon hypophthalmus]|uniref:acyl-coenzyme A amino acid N-acyltransferase 2 isoform X1 n=2 Tax=Pangasianodon hypophthalmus TaxID=310915 RepID=UPI002306E112|nr:acyl-coenzyme A amino acid N-acyltransferase 2 isoform X1 [Pangasianodon hypophthalmus]